MAKKGGSRGGRNPGKSGKIWGKFKSFLKNVSRLTVGVHTARAPKYTFIKRTAAENRRFRGENLGGIFRIRVAKKTKKAEIFGTHFGTHSFAMIFDWIIVFITYVYHLITMNCMISFHKNAINVVYITRNDSLNAYFVCIIIDYTHLLYK